MNADELTQAQIDDVLRSELTGRIGCHAEGRTYVIPVTYAYDGESVYARSSDGLKVRTMRANPDVCFEVEQIHDRAQWRTVVSWGRYEELAGPDEDRARKWLEERMPPFETTRAASRHRDIFYRIRLVERTGRLERR